MAYDRAMKFTSPTKLAALSSLLALVACGAPVAPGDASPSDVAREAQALIDSAATDAAALDAGSDASAHDDGAAQDSGPALDAGSDASALDARTDGASSLDATRADAVADASARPDVAPADTGARDAAADVFVPPPSCMYTNVNDLAVDCGGTIRLVNYFDVVPASSMCPGYWQLGSAAPAFTAEQAAVNGGCSTACIWRFSMSVTRLYCGVRSGYEVLEGTPNRCGQRFRFSEGYFNSVAEHDAMYPCRDR